MCGIAGIALSSGDWVDKDLLHAMMDTLTHRGPDGVGCFINPGIGLGSCRLSIIDVEGGGQPIFNEDRSVVVVFNGEIYNYLELRERLAANGHALTTSSDTEVLVHLYEDLGTSCVSVLNGMFSFAIWDTKRRQLFIARDRLGEKPLYYCQVDRQLVFASELRALLTHPAIIRRMDLKSLDDYLSYGYVPGSQSIVSGVRKLLPGHHLVWRSDSLAVEQYWGVSLCGANSESDADRVVHLQHLLRESVRMRLRSDVPLGVFLSGGVDSSTVAALAAEVSGTPIKTFTVGFDEADWDEVAFAREVAQKVGSDHYELRTRVADATILPELASSMDEPLADPSALPTYYLCREARKHVKVCLSGDGGDELFAGYSRYREAAAYRWIDFIPGPARRLIFGAASAGLPAHVFGKGFFHRLATNEAERYYSLVAVFLAEERAALFRPECRWLVSERPWLVEAYLRASDGRDLVARLQHTDQQTYLPDDILVKADRMSMRHSLELRLPFLDHHVVEYVNAWPTSTKLRHGNAKRLLKQMIKNLVPDTTIDRPKKGFGIPIKRWFRDHLSYYPREVLSSSSCRIFTWLDPVAVRDVAQAHQRGMRDFSDKIWALLVLELWCRAHNVS
jgi:asparagine synthase (glutamine-hydrolysing)